MKEQLKSFVRKSPFLLKAIRNFREGKMFEKSYLKSVQGKNNVFKIETSARLNSCKFDIIGNSNCISIDDESVLNNVVIFIRGNKNQIIISREVKFNRGGELWVEDDFCELFIGEKSTFEDTHIAITEPKSKCTIGKDCMFANDIDIRTGDSHSIIDVKSQKRINHAGNVSIADHVWVGAHASILKGSSLAPNSIVATRSVVTKRFEEGGVIIAGIPAKVVKQDITWDRKRIY